MAFGADRSVVVKIKADVSDFLSQITAARRATQDFASDAAHSAEQNSQAWENVGKTMLVAGGAIAAGVALAVKKFADFDKEMSTVRAVSGASANEMTKLSAAALQAGADTQYSASEAAQATGELAKVGISTSDILGGALTGSLNLAAAGNLDLAQAAEISGQAMKLFNLAGKDVPRIADTLAAGANKSAADVTDLAQALSQGGLVAAQTGLTLEDTVGTLSAFADNALMGSDAGTSFKTMLQRLNPQSAQAQQLMDQLGLSAYDAQGNFVGITAYAGKLQGALSKMSVEQRNAALQTLFGSDAVRAATVLYNLGAQGLEQYVQGVKDQGAAARVAAINMDNLSGDVEQLKGSLETLLIQGGSAGNGPLRELVQGITSVVNAIGSLPQPVLDVGLGLSAFVAAALLAGGAALTLVPKIVELRTAMTTLGVSTARTSAILKGVGWAGLVVAVAAVGAELLKLSARAGVADVKVSDLADSLDSIARGSKSAGSFGDLFDNSGIGPFKHEVTDTSEALTKFSDAAQQAVGTNFGDRIERWGGATDSFNKQVGQIDAAMAQMVQSGNIDGATKLYDQLMEAIKRANEQGANIPADKVAAKFKLYQEALDAAKNAQKQTAVQADGLGGAINGVEVSAKDAADAVDKLVQSLADAGLVQLSSRDAVRQYKQSLDDAATALKKNGETLNLNTQKGRDNQSALDDVAQATIRSAQATYERVKATDGVGPAEAAFRSTLTKSRDKLIQTARSFGMSKKDAENYADAVLNIPAVKNTKVSLSGAAAAISAAGRIAAAIAKIPGRKTTDVVVRKIGAQNDALTRADGGRIPLGLGGPREDNVLVAASSGEFFVNAASTAKHLPLLEAINADRFADGGLVGFASGGQVGAGTNADLIRLFGKDLGAQVVQAFADGMSGGKGAVKSVAEQIRSIVSDNAKKAADDLKSLLDSEASYAKQVAGSFLSAGSLTDATAQGKSFTVGPDGVMRENTPSPFEDQLTSAIGQTKGFESTIDRLVKLGARTDVLQEFLDKGPAAADAAAALAAMGKSGVANVNRLQGELVAATSSLGSLGASAVYGPRIQAARTQVVDTKALEVAVTKATASEVAETRKVTAELQRVNVQLQRQAQDLANALARAGAAVQNSARNKPGSR